MKKTRILIVEDEALTAKSIEKTLVGFGYSVTGLAITGEDAIIQAKNNPPDLVLMDIRLGGKIDGIETARAIIAERNIPVIFTTAHSDGDTLSRAKTIGPYGYLVKPLKPNDIKSAIELALYRFAMEQKLIRSEEKYRELVDNINDVIYSLDESGTILYISNQIMEIGGFDPSELIGKSFLSFIHEDDRESLYNVFVLYSAGYSEPVDFRARSKDGEIHWFMAHGRAVMVDGIFRGIKGVMNDRTSAKKAEIELKSKNDEIEAAYHELKREKNLISLVMEMSPAGILMISGAGIILFANLRAEEVLGYSRGEIVGEKYISNKWEFRDIDGGEYPFRKNPVRSVLKTGKPVYDSRMKLIRSGGDGIDLSVNASPMFNENAMIEAVVLSVEDITAARKADEMIRASLREKEVLLKEIHHRIKNNFQIILSLISLQAQYFNDEKDIDLIQQTQQRIRSVAVIYEKLYVSDRISTIMLDEYIRDLSDEIFNSMDAGRGLSVTKNFKSVEVSVNTAITCGIIINELLTNIAKHAFEPGSGGSIAIDCASAGGTVSIKISDNGRGLPPGADPENAQSMGFQLVHALSRQIGGELRFSPGVGAGTTCVLSFPLTVKKVK